MRWLWLGWPVAGELWDDESWHELATRAVRRARGTGVLSVLPLGAHLPRRRARARRRVRCRLGAHRGGRRDHGGDRQRAARYAAMLLAAWRGKDAEASALLQAGPREAIARGEGRAIGWSAYLAAVLHNGLGRYRAALASAQQACEHDDLGVFGFSLVELIEAATRSDAREVAAAALRQLQERADASGTDWALGVLARSERAAQRGPVRRVAVPRGDRTPRP